MGIPSWRLRPVAVVACLALSSSACAAHAAGRLNSPSPFPTAQPPRSIRPTFPLAPVVIPLGSVLETALKFQGVPYRFGGEDPATGFDCSGFTRFVFGQFQFALPRTAAEQFHLGSRVDLEHLRAGDLVFFSTVAPGASHVGLALNEDEFVHAPAASGQVRIERVRSSYWRARFVGARRVL